MKQKLTQRLAVGALALALTLSPLACGRPRSKDEPGRRPGIFEGWSSSVICGGALDGLNDFLENIVPGYNSGRGPYDDIIKGGCYNTPEKKNN